MIENINLVACEQCSYFQEAETGVIGRCFVYQQQISNNGSLLDNSRLYAELGGLEFLTTMTRECKHFSGKYAFVKGEYVENE